LPEIDVGQQPIAVLPRIAGVVALVVRDPHAAAEGVVVDVFVGTQHQALLGHRTIEIELVVFGGGDLVGQFGGDSRPMPLDDPVGGGDLIGAMRNSA